MRTEEEYVENEEFDDNAPDTVINTGFTTDGDDVEFGMDYQGRYYLLHRGTYYEGDTKKDLILEMGSASRIEMEETGDDLAAWIIDSYEQWNEKESLCE